MNDYDFNWDTYYYDMMDRDVISDELPSIKYIHEERREQDNRRNLGRTHTY